MSIEAIDFLPAGKPIEIETNATQPQNFEKWLNSQLQNVNGTLIKAEHQLQSLAVGDVENLHQVMIAMGEAKFTFQLAMQVRNRVLEAYQEVLRMQV